MSNRTLFDWAAAQEAKHEGMQRAYAHAGSTWKVIAEDAAKKLLSEQLYVTADDLRQAVPMSPSHFNAWGALTLRLVKAGWMEPTGEYVTSKQVQGHGNRLAKYRSRLYGRQVAA